MENCSPVNKVKVFGGRQRTEEKTMSVRELYLDMRFCFCVVCLLVGRSRVGRSIE